MQEELISIETAKLAKEKGFDWKTENVYSPKNEPNKSKHEFTDSDWDSLKYLKEAIHFPYEHFTHISAPTQSLLQKWLREVHNIHTNVHYGLTFTFKINGDLKGNDYVDYSEMDKFWGRTYEEALEKGLQEALKLI